MSEVWASGGSPTAYTCSALPMAENVVVVVVIAAGALVAGNSAASTHPETKATRADVAACRAVDGFLDIRTRASSNVQP
jgi:hypothetical protein